MCIRDRSAADASLPTAKRVGTHPTQTELAIVAGGAVALAFLYRRRLSSPVVPDPGVSLEDIAKFPGGAGLGMADAPAKIEFAPSGDAITYLASPPGALSQKLFQMEVATGATTELIGSSAGEESYSAEEKMRRERLRLLHTGVTLSLIHI